MNKSTLINYLNDRCTTAELQEIIRWIEGESLSDNGKTMAFDQWKSFQEKDHPEDDEKFSILFDKIQHKINTREQFQRTKGESKKRILFWLIRAAAVLFVPVTLFLGYLFTQNPGMGSRFSGLSVDSAEVIAPIGSRTVVQLSDGTHVHLNYGSKLKYPLNFTGNTRKVILTGEGFFEVASNPEKPFVVNTGAINIKAVGTKFNVLSYPDDNLTETTLTEGKVILEQCLPGGELKVLGSMVPGQHVKYHSGSGKITTTKGEVDQYTAWKNGMMVFRETPIAEVAKKLSRKYNVDIEVKPDIMDFDYTVTFMDEPLNQILELMTIATPVDYEIKPRKKLPDGSFSKQKIIIKKKT